MSIESKFEASIAGINPEVHEWVAPLSAPYKITVFGAQGGGTHGGLGAKMSGDFDFVEGDRLLILVGEHGVPLNTSNGSGDNNSSGGGGSFVTKVGINSNEVFQPLGEPVVLLIAAGGGGGSHGSGHTQRHGLTSTSGGKSSTNEPGGTEGNGGSSAGSGAWAGAGYKTGPTNGGDAQPFLNGGLGGTTDDFNHGGFGGGGSSSDAGSYSRTGGGGGYSGGGSARASGSQSGGGGGSFNSGRNQSNSFGVREGHGYVVITALLTGKIQGQVFGKSGPVEKEVYIYSRDDGTLLGSGLSDSLTGEFSIPITESVSGKHFVVVLDKTENKNALVFDQIAAEAL